MKKINDYAKVFETLVQKTQDYIVNNNLQAMILGISGGIDSTVVAAICHEISKRIGIPLIGRSLPTKYNKLEEIESAKLVGEAFCNSFTEVSIKRPYDSFMSLVTIHEGVSTPLSRGNIQARLRMIYLYNLASIHNGIVMDTDNLTENNLGYFTIHGDVGDFNPIGGLWKTEVFELAEYLKKYYMAESYYHENYSEQKQNNSLYAKYIAISSSLELKPTAGLGITNNDLEELGAESYEQVDSILQEILAWKYMTLWINDVPIDQTTPWEQRNAFLKEQQMLNIPIEVIIAVTDRHFKSEFKRKQLPIKITRDEI